MTTAQDLVDAVRPCLPLPGTRKFEFANDRAIRVTGDGLSFTCTTDLAGRIVIGEIWQACAERGWSIHLDPQDEGGSVTIFYGHIMERASTTEYVTVRGTDAIALCRAYAAACEAGKGAT